MERCNVYFWENTFAFYKNLTVNYHSAFFSFAAFSVSQPHVLRMEIMCHVVWTEVSCPCTQMTHLIFFFFNLVAFTASVQ